MLALLPMLGMFRAAKFWTAVVMAIVQFVHIYANIDLGLDEATATAVIGGLGAALVWLIPNFRQKPEIPVLTLEEMADRIEKETGVRPSIIPDFTR